MVSFAFLKVIVGYFIESFIFVRYDTIVYMCVCVCMYKLYTFVRFQVLIVNSAITWRSAVCRVPSWAAFIIPWSVVCLASLYLLFWSMLLGAGLKFSLNIGAIQRIPTRHDMLPLLLLQNDYYHYFYVYHSLLLPLPLLVPLT